MEDTNLIAGAANTWRWTLDPSGVFSVKEHSKKIDQAILMSSVVEKATSWNSWIPQKINVCRWWQIENMNAVDAQELLSFILRNMQGKEQRGAILFISA